MGVGGGGSQVVTMVKAYSKCYHPLPSMGPNSLGVLLQGCPNHLQVEDVAIANTSPACALREPSREPGGPTGATRRLDPGPPPLLRGSLYV